MLSIKVKNDADSNGAAVEIEIQVSASNIFTEIVIGAVSAIKKITDDRLSYDEASRLLCALINDFKDYEEG